MSHRLVARAHLISFAVLIGVIGLVGLLSWDRLNAARSARDWTMHTYEVLGTIRNLGMAVREAEDGQRGYLLTGADADIAMYDSAVENASVMLGNLQRLTADNPTQQQHLHELGMGWQQRLQQLAQVIQVRRDRGLQVAAGIVGTEVGRATSNTIMAALSDMKDEEQRLLTQRLNDLDRRGTWVRWLVLLGGVLSMGGLIAASRLINLAWKRSNQAEAQQRVLASRLRATLESLSQGVAVFGPARHLRHWNECFQVLLDLPPAMMREATPYAAFVEHAVGRDAPLLEIEQQLAAVQESATDPVVHERWTRDGRLLEVRRTPTPDGGFVLTISDMTKRAESEALLRDAQKMQAIGQLTGGIAHDFNNLLTVIMGNLELARARVEAQHPLATNIERALWAAQRGGTLTGQLLAFARKQPLTPAPIDLSSTLPDMVPLLRRTLGEHIDVRFVDSAGLWPAMADPAQLESAVLNLALNARDAMPGGGRLTIELANKVLDRDYARRHTEVVAGDYVMVAVSDTGHGMTADIVARVFEPFFTTKTEGRGTGLGLPMVFGFVKQSGGHIKIYSEPGEGTAVKIYLPRAVGVQPAVVQRDSESTDLPFGDATILVVEDEAGVREIAVAILRSLGYRVLEAADGEEALRVFAANAAAVDMLLSDVVLPGKVRGREVAERITALRPEIKVLFMSGYTENAIVHHGRLDDGVQLLGKPFKREQLARKVAEVLGSVRQAASPNVVDLRSRNRD